MADTAQMWKRYTFMGHEVEVIQKWRDPFGRNMVGVQVADQDLTGSFLEDVFLRDAAPVEAGDTASRR
ncbi:MAG: hypothetical protein ABTQ31_01720 [Rhizobiaceae bacterium]